MVGILGNKAGHLTYLWEEQKEKKNNSKNKVNNNNKNLTRECYMMRNWAGS